MFENKNKVAIVTGAAKNIGRATCESLSKLGYNILVHANSDKEGADETIKLIKQTGILTNRVIGDLTNPETSKELVSEASKLGKISFLVKLINFFFVEIVLKSSIPKEIPAFVA